MLPKIDYQELGTILNNTLAPHQQQLDSLFQKLKSYRKTHATANDSDLIKLLSEFEQLNIHAELLNWKLERSLLSFLLSLQMESARNAKKEYDNDLQQLWKDIKKMEDLCFELSIKRDDMKHLNII